MVSPRGHVSHRKGPRQRKIHFCFGVFVSVGAAPFAIGLYIGKVLTLQIIAQSIFGLLFVLLGFYFGEGLRKRVTQNWFEKALLLAFCIMGIRLIAVGLF